MADNHTPETRSYNMSQIRSKDTKPEEIVRKYLFSQGFRDRKNVKELPGHPDIVLPKYKTIVFVHGCFWHMHNCGSFHWPSTNKDYWENKIRKNVERDILNERFLKSAGWKVIVIWECELKNSQRNKALSELVQRITAKE